MAIPYQLLSERLRAKIKLLDEGVWEQRASQLAIDAWLANFTGDVDDTSSERYHALYLLSRFMYFGETEIRQLLRAMFRDLYRQPILEEARRGAVASTDPVALEAAFQGELAVTKFLGLGNPAESGTHLLYYFRQENELRKQLFVDTHQLFDRRMDSKRAQFRDAGLRHLVFIDDFCGSGATALDYSQTVLPMIKAVAGRSAIPLTTTLLFLFGTTSALDDVRTDGEFDRVEAVVEMDGTYKCFEPESRYFKAADPLPDRMYARGFCESYGYNLLPSYPLGFADGQLLIGFHHNVPDNTLPVVWSDEDPSWVAMFRRYRKLGA